MNDSTPTATEVLAGMAGGCILAAIIIYIVGYWFGF
jgi:hypothetical protein